MRSVLAAVLACLFVVMTTADRLVCPDGCTDDAPAQATLPHASAPCALCLGWSQSPLVVASRPSDRVVARRVLTARTPAPPALPTLDPPPKSV